jgi:curved DNA-binding protein
MTDHYSTLGIPHGATPEEIKRAYRKMASSHHPDKGGDKAKFQEIQAAYDTLSDPNARAQYDNPQPQGFHFEFNGPGGFDFNNIFNMFGQQFHQHPGRQQRQHTRMSLWVTLQDVAEGGVRTVTVGTGHGTMAIEIEIPLGIDDGAHVQYGGIGPGGTDLIVNFRIHPNPKWHRQGLNLTTEHPVSVWDCLTGAESTVRDILGNTYTLNIPPLTQPNSLLRLKGCGLRSRDGQQGDLLIKIQARMPKSIDPDLIERIKQAQK